MTAGNKRTTNLATPLPNSLTANKFWLQTGVVLEAPDRVTNASVRAPLDTSTAYRKPPARQGAEDFLKYRSFGSGC